jgi:hypothetical protein
MRPSIAALLMLTQLAHVASSQATIRVQRIARMSGPVQVFDGDRVPVTIDVSDRKGHVRARIFAASLTEIQDIITRATSIDCLEFDTRVYSADLSASIALGPEIALDWVTVNDDGTLRPRLYVIVLEQVQDGDRDGPNGDPSVLRLTPLAARRYFAEALEFSAMARRHSVDPRLRDTVLRSLNTSESTYRSIIVSRAPASCTSSVIAADDPLGLEFRAVACGDAASRAVVGSANQDSAPPS